MAVTDYENDWALLVNTPAQAEYLLNIREQVAAGNNNANKTEYIYFKQKEPSWLKEVIL